MVGAVLQIRWPAPLYVSNHSGSRAVECATARELQLLLSVCRQRGLNKLTSETAWRPGTGVCSLSGKRFLENFALSFGSYRGPIGCMSRMDGWERCGVFRDIMVVNMAPYRISCLKSVAASYLAIHGVKSWLKLVNFFYSKFALPHAMSLRRLGFVSM